MEKLSDDEIQRLLENGLSFSNPSGKEAEDIKTYELLFEQLAQKPELEPSWDFSDKIVERLQAKKDLADNFNYYFSLLGIILLGIICAVAAITYMNMSIGNQIFLVVLKFKWVLVFGVGLFLLIQYLDQKLVRQKMNL